MSMAEHIEKKSVLHGMLHKPIYLAMTIATQIAAANKLVCVNEA